VEAQNLASLSQDGFPYDPQRWVANASHYDQEFILGLFSGAFVESVKFGEAWVAKAIW
jgi:hypothetical protein